MEQLTRTSLHARCGLALAGLALLAFGCATDGGATQRFEEERKTRAHYNLALEHMRDGRAALAIRELQAAEKIDPTDAWVQLSLAEAFRHKGLDQDTERHLLRALELDPALQSARLNLSALYVHLGRNEEAITHARMLLDDPTFPVPWKALANLGWAQYQLGRAAEARTSLEHALEFNEDFWPARLSLASIDAEQGRRLEAIEGFEQVLRAATGPLAAAEANYRLAEVYISLGNRTKAVHHLTAASATRPSGIWGKRSEDYLKRLH